jgi:hypothetical protein
VGVFNWRKDRIMAKKRYTPETIIRKRREAEVNRNWPHPARGA